MHKKTSFLNIQRRNNAVDKIEQITQLYESGLSVQDVADKLKLGKKVLRSIMDEYQVKLRNSSEQKRVSKKYQQAMKNRKYFTPWSKGLTRKTDKRIDDRCKKFSENVKKNKTFVGKNNPMYGKVTHSRSGFRKDLGHSVRSSWEANFARILKYLNITYEYEKQTFDLGDTTYTPDFYIPTKDTFYEVKGFLSHLKHVEFSKKYNKKVVLVNEKFYNRLIYYFGDKVKLDSKKSLLSKKEINNLFLSYYKESDFRISVQAFCDSIGFSRKMIIKLYGSTSGISKYNEDIIKQIDRERLVARYLKFYGLYQKYPTYVEMKKFYTRTQTLLTKTFNNIYTDLKKEALCRG